MQLYDIINKKVINVDNIDFNIKNDIINKNKRILKKSELKKKIDYKKYAKDIKTALSTDDNILPLYDINNNKIYFIRKNNVFYLINENNFRPLNDNLIKFIKENKLNNDNIIDIINLFDFSILEKQLLKFIFYNTREIGENITYFLNPAYINFLDINPYLKKTTIINVSLNTGIIKYNQIDEFKNKIDILYNKIKTYLFYKSEILNHMNHITSNNMTKVIKFYTIYGAFFLNNYLRNKSNTYHDENIINQIKKLNSLIRNSPPLISNKLIFRYVKNDDFLKGIKIGEYYIENSFMSCTRKPNINSMNDSFGFILLKIIIPSDIKGSCLSIESDSLFPEEKEIIIAPGSKFKLIGIDENVEFFVFNKNTQRNIKKKYELVFVGFEELKIPEYKKIKSPEIDFIKNNLDGENLEEKIDFFWDNYGRVARKFYIILPNGEKKILYCNYYDSTDIYSKFFQYKLPDGLFIYSYNENNEIDIFIEIGDIAIVNFPSKFISIKSNDNIILIVSLICYGFRIDKISLYPDFIPISEITKSKNNDELFLSRIYLNSIIYNLIYDKKSGNKINDKSNIIEYLNSKVAENKINYNIQQYNYAKSYSELIKNVLNGNSFNMKYVNLSLPTKIINSYFDISPYNYLLNNNIIYDIPHTSSKYINRRVLKSPEFFSIETNNFRNIIRKS